MAAHGVPTGLPWLEVPGRNGFLLHRAESLISSHSAAKNIGHTGTWPGFDRSLGRLRAVCTPHDLQSLSELLSSLFPQILAWEMRPDLEFRGRCAPIHDYTTSFCCPLTALPATGCCPAEDLFVRATMMKPYQLESQQYCLKLPHLAHMTDSQCGRWSSWTSCSAITMVLSKRALVETNQLAKMACNTQPPDRYR
ncbi:hypothetical protein CC78DRAFT_579189 [Lojkania enalia]|uniref:Uncharacterized protein n=1 Tax=Lojkania enalia TaxID=147567 RepID=A0A9P4KAG9_9PLEO|nr:hypothetical protein CC78DRAFT_579189 [Didymosphaeria enalia]